MEYIAKMVTRKGKVLKKVVTDDFRVACGYCREFKITHPHSYVDIKK